ACDVFYISCCFFVDDPSFTDLPTVSLHDALPIYPVAHVGAAPDPVAHGHDRRARVPHREDASGQDQRRVLGVDELVAVRTSASRSEEHTSELQSRENLVCRLLLEKKNKHLMT